MLAALCHSFSQNHDRGDAAPPQEGPYKVKPPDSLPGFVHPKITAMV